MIKRTYREHNGIFYEVLGDKRFKYKLLKDYWFDTGIKLKKPICIDHIELKTTGRCHIRKGFMWDGATCFFDIQSVMRGSCEHDALYALFVLGLLKDKHRKTVNGRFKKTCIKDGMSKTLANILFFVLCRFGGRHIRKAMKKKDITIQKEV